MAKLNNKKPDGVLIFVIILLSIAYTTMLIGLGIDDSHDDYAPFIPLLYFATFICLLYFHRGWSMSFLFFIAVTLVGAFLIQFANVKCDWLYGQIKYGSILGPKLLGVPIVAPFNRFVLLYCAGMLVKQLKLKNDIYSALIAAFVLLLVNLIAEPVAISLQLRKWSSHMYPFQNFGVRYVISFIFLYFFYSTMFNKKNKIYLPIFILEVIFLLVLNLEMD